jgi:polyhydroxyalkanoate depolymerase
MIYQAYQAQSDLAEAIRAIGGLSLAAIDPWKAYDPDLPLGHFDAAGTLMARAGLTHARPDYRIEKVRVGNRDAQVTEVPVFSTPFGTLLHFSKDVDVAQPRVLVVAPLSGHFATLLRNTVQTLLADHDVYISDWHNARMSPHPTAPSVLTTMSSMSSAFSRRSAPARMCLRSASPACRCSQPRR